MASKVLPSSAMAFELITAGLALGIAVVGAVEYVATGMTDQVLSMGFRLVVGAYLGKVGVRQGLVAWRDIREDGPRGSGPDRV